MSINVHTYYRGIVDIEELRHSDIDIRDIALSLSRSLRYNGHTRFPYSVARHSLILSKQFEDKTLALQALLHDASEAYIGDIVHPLKRRLCITRTSHAETLESLERRIQFAILRRFGVTPFATNGKAFDPVVDEVHDRLYVTEVRDVVGEAHPGDDWGVSATPLDMTIEDKQGFSFSTYVDEFDFERRFKELCRL